MRIQKVKYPQARVIETAKRASVDLCRWVEKIIEEI